MDRIEPESFRLFCPDVAGVFVGREPFEGLEAPGEVVGGDEVAEVAAELVVAVVVVAFDGCFLDRPVHPFDLAVGPRMVRLGQPMLDAMALAGPIEGMATQHRSWPFAVLREVGELDAVVGEHRVDEVGHGVDQGVEEGCCRLGVGAFDELHEGELRGPVDGNEEVELAFGGSHFGDVDVEVADRVALEGLLRRLVALDLRQPADAVAQEAAVQGRAGEPWDGRLQGVETVI